MDLSSLREVVAARELLNAVRGMELAENERVERAILLAAKIQEAANATQTSHEREFGKELSGMMHDPKGKIFTTELTDEAFRSSNNARVADQIRYLVKRFGVPSYLTAFKRLGLYLFSLSGRFLSFMLVPLMRHLIRKMTSKVILPGEEEKLRHHLELRKKDGVRVNLNHLGEAILGEEEAAHRLAIYLNDLRNSEVEYISVKISTLFSQINLLAWDESLSKLAVPYRMLLKEAQLHRYENHVKFVNLDMEEYKDLRLTVALFKKVLSEPEFLTVSAGIVLQSYLPDSFPILNEIVEFAKERAARGGAPLKVRIVKGANLAMEKVEASLKGWPQAPYKKKCEVDANFKRMVHYAMKEAGPHELHLGIASHNLFDISYALLLREEKGLQQSVIFEMLEGMADASRRVVQILAGEILLYCPSATAKEFQNAVAYLVRRLDENTGPENFLRYSFDLKPGSKTWQHQADLFAAACRDKDKVYAYPRRQQHRGRSVIERPLTAPFENDPDTDWCLPQNRKWGEKIVEKWKEFTALKIPCVIDGSEIYGEQEGQGVDPSEPNQTPFTFHLATLGEIRHAIETSQNSFKEWSSVLPVERAEILKKVSCEFQLHRDALLGAMLLNCGKPLHEGDPEISEAVDFIEYYLRSILEWSSFEDLELSSKGPVLVASPWNFPCSIPTGCISAALASGNTVLFKPAPEAVLVGYELVKLFWAAGVPRSVLQFIPCKDEIAAEIVKDMRVSMVALTGATATAKLLMSLRPGLDLVAETGGKNAMIVTAMADRDLAIKDIVQSAFGFSGQKCSACSLLILEEEVYEDPQFKKQLLDATSSLKCGSAWDLAVKINPLIHPPSGHLLRAIQQLDPGEEWLLRPTIDPQNPRAVTPGIKWGVQPGSFTHQTELFGPVLAVMKAKDLNEAIEFANATAYGLTSGIHTLDVREQELWTNKIQAGNLYINRGITGAIVERQPFGGCKASSFGKGSKAGGPNYILQFLKVNQKHAPLQRYKLSDRVRALIDQVALNESEKEIIEEIGENYSFFYRHYFTKAHDPMKISGQDNLQFYVPASLVVIRASKADRYVDILGACVAAETASVPYELSLPPSMPQFACLTGIIESDSTFLERISAKGYKKIRLLSEPLDEIKEGFAKLGIEAVTAPVVSNGRVELLHVLREVSLSRDYHRYGNLGEREHESRGGADLATGASYSSCCENRCCRCEGAGS